MLSVDACLALIVTQIAAFSGKQEIRIQSFLFQEEGSRDLFIRINVAVVEMILVGKYLKPGAFVGVINETSFIRALCPPTLWLIHY